MRNAGIEHLEQAALGDAARLGRVGTGQEHGEGVTPVPGHQFSGALHAQAHDTRHLPQAFVAPEVAIVVVVTLEQINIDHQKRQAGLVARTSLPFVAQGLFELPAVGDADQAIDRGQAHQLLVGAFQGPSFFEHGCNVQARHDQVTRWGAGFTDMDARPTVDDARRRPAQGPTTGQAQGQPLFLASDRFRDVSAHQSPAQQGFVTFANDAAVAPVGVDAGYFAVVGQQAVLVVVDGHTRRKCIDHLVEPGLGGTHLVAQDVQLLLLLRHGGGEILLAGACSPLGLSAHHAQGEPCRQTECQQHQHPPRKGDDVDGQRFHRASVWDGMAPAYQGLHRPPLWR